MLHSCFRCVEMVVAIDARFCKCDTNRPHELRVQFLWQLQESWRTRVQRFKASAEGDGWWADLKCAPHSELERSLWTAVVAREELQELRVAAFPPWFLSRPQHSCTEAAERSHDTALYTTLSPRKLDFAGVEWYEHPAELTEAWAWLDLSNLHTLVLHGQEIVVDEHLEAVAAVAPQLVAADVSYCCQLTDIGVLALIQSSRRTLQSLVCNGLRKLTSKSIRELETCKELQTLQLEDCLGVDRLPAFTEASPRLTALNLQGLSNLSDRDVHDFIARKYGAPLQASSLAFTP